MAVWVDSHALFYLIYCAFYNKNNWNCLNYKRSYILLYKNLLDFFMQAEKLQIYFVSLWFEHIFLDDNEMFGAIPDECWLLLPITIQVTRTIWPDLEIHTLMLINNIQINISTL